MSNECRDDNGRFSDCGPSKGSGGAKALSRATTISAGNGAIIAPGNKMAVKEAPTTKSRLIGIGRTALGSAGIASIRNNKGGIKRGVKLGR